MNTDKDLSDLSLNDTEELISSYQNRSIESLKLMTKEIENLKSSETYTNTFETSEKYSHETPCTSSKPTTYSKHSGHEISSPKFASTYRQTRPQTANPQRTGVKVTNKVRPQSAYAQRKQTTVRKKRSKPDESLETTQELLNIYGKSNANMSVWENWLLEKVQLEREIQRKVKERKRQEEDEKKRIERENEEKRKLAERHHHEWCEHKQLKIHMQHQTEVRKKKLEKELKQSEQARKETRSEQEYLKWMEKKAAIEHEKAQKEKEVKRKKEQEKHEREQKNKEKFEEWLQKVKTKPKSPVKPNQGIITNYPEPGYKNPAPWVGPLSDRLPRREERQNKPKKRPTTAKCVKSKPTCSTPKAGFKTHKPSSDRGVLIMRPLSASVRSR